MSAYPEQALQKVLGFCKGKRVALQKVLLVSPTVANGLAKGLLLGLTN